LGLTLVGLKIIKGMTSLTSLGIHKNIQIVLGVNIGTLKGEFKAKNNVA